MNCSFNIRYKPRTTRAFTKNDLTVYDSAGNTALNALTVYGKSEVVDGAIKSAGEGGSIEIETCEKNLIDITKSVDIVRPDDVTRNGLSFFGLNGTYTLSQGTGSSLFYYGVWDGNRWSETGSIQPNTSKTISLNATKSLWLWVAENQQMSQLITTAQLEYGTTATAYEPYNGTMAVFETGTPLYSVSDTVRDVMTWDGSAGTVTKNCAKVRLADLTWNYNSNLRLFNTSLPTATIKQGQEKGDKCLCNKYEDINNYLIPFNNWNSFPNGYVSCGCGYDYGGYINLVIKDTDHTTVSDFVASLGDAELIYELATPTTEQLTTTENASIAGLRTFAPQTHISNNAGTDMTVDYTIKVPTI